MKTLLISLLFFSTFTYAQVEKKYEIDALKNDLSWLKQKLQRLHPNLYLYTNRPGIDKAFDSLANTINKPMTGQEFYKHISILSSIIKDGHTIMLPDPNSTSFHNASSKFLPYKLRLINNKLFVEQVLTDEKAINAGTEIISLNGITAEQIIQQLSARLVRDGFNETYPQWIIDTYFRDYYSFIFGHPEQFNIEYKKNEITATATIPALPKDSIGVFRKLKYPDQVTIHKPKDGITFSMQPDQHYACLTIKDFHKEVLKKEYKQDFKTEISNAFNLIAENNIQQLIIDLRNNQGGDLEYGVYLLSYLLDEPFRILDQYYKVGADETNDELVKTNGEESGIHACKENRFKGKVYVLINGGSFSNSGIVASALKIHNRAVFIGSETAGNNKVLAGYTKELNLPATNIYVEIPTRQFMLYEKLPLSGHGTMPDHMITPTIEDIMANRDPVKEFTLRLINEK